MKDKILSLPKSFWMESVFFIVFFLGVGAFLRTYFRDLISYTDLALVGILLAVFFILFEIYKK